MPEPQNHKLTDKQQRMLSEYKQRQSLATQSGAEPVKEIGSIINSIETLYKAVCGDKRIQARALLILRMRSWLTEVSNFDPVTGDALATGIVDFMSAVAHQTDSSAFEGEIKDRVYRIATHTQEAIQAIFGHARDKILREHAMLPIYAAREVDSISVQWLSRQPGRTIREKLSGKPNIKAVQRRASFDTSENKLLKAFLLRFEQTLIERQSALNNSSEETCEELLVLMQRWLRSENAAEIGYWGNLPPNNTLLQDKRYRKVWDAWLWMQSLDEHIVADYKRMNQDVLSVIYWKTLSLLNKTGRFRTIQQPISLDYDKFTITPSLPVTGYLFPEIAESRIIGTIGKLVSEKRFGFIDGFFFHASDLSGDLKFDELRVGQQLLFEIENSNKGECAKRLMGKNKRAPVAIRIKLENNHIEIHFGNSEILVEAAAEFFTLIQKTKGTKKNFELKLSIYNEVSEAILSLLTDTSLHNCATLDNQKDLTQSDMSIIDLCSIRPRFTDNAGSQVLLPFRLLQQHWFVNTNSEVTIDCGESKAIVFRSDIETISMRGLFAHNSTLSDAVKSTASMFFTKKLRDYIPTKRLSYLIPDWGNDFDLECIRKSVNFYFDESTPLPKSIAAIFAWKSSKRFNHDKVREKDLVLVVDAFDGGISITPVQAVYQKELYEILPITKGISWERHPAFIIGNKNIHSDMVRNLSRDGCLISEELIQLFGFDGLVHDAGSLSCVNNDDWYHLPSSIRDVLNQNLDENAISMQTIGNCLNSINRDSRGVTVFILPLEDTIKKPQLERHCQWLGSAWSPIKGCQTLNEWQKDADNIALWRDHLPELSIRIVRNGRFENFYLVKDTTVTPQRGRAVPIPVKESFTLSAGQPHYSFPLQQGSGNQELLFVAYLKSPSFPLKEDTACKLEMNYTYGADDPYELKLIPLDMDCTEFKSIRVEWRPITESTAIDLANLPVPTFPARKTWSDFQKFPKEDSKSFSDLLDWCSSKLEYLSELASFDFEQELNDLLSKRKVGYLEWGTKDRSGKYYCRVSVDGESVFCHSSQFIEPADENTLHEGSLVYLDVFINDKGSSGSDISFSESLPNKLQEKYREIVRYKLSNKISFIEKGIFSLRFPVLTIWNNGHSLSELETPSSFRKSVLNGTSHAVSIIQSQNGSDSLKEELFFFLCCLHKDAPSLVGNRLLETVTDKKGLRQYHRNIAFAIGEAELPWQKELLASVINPIDNEGLTRSITMEVLSIAFEGTHLSIN